MATFNLASPNGLFAPCVPSNLEEWLDIETNAINPESVRAIVRSVLANMDDFVHWPKEAILLWSGCDRITPPGKSQRIHRYPLELKGAVASFDDWDERPNGPAIAAFVVAGGIRPCRFGSKNAWSIHHIYSGKFPHRADRSTMHATKNGLHFTQSAGLVAVHPIADALCDEFPFFTWLLRAKAFIRFGYDPDAVFGTEHDSLGCRIIYAP